MDRCTEGFLSPAVPPNLLGPHLNRKFTETVFDVSPVACISCPPRASANVHPLNGPGVVVHYLGTVNDCVSEKRMGSLPPHVEQLLMRLATR